MVSTNRLVSGRDFQRVYRSGKAVGNRCMGLKFLRREESSLRMGVVAGKELGSAVHRNRAKRLLREALRLNRARMKEGFDLVVIARKGIRGLSCAETEKDLVELLAKADLLKDRK